MSKKALIVGGGFAGLEAAIQLRKRGLDVTLVSNRPFLFIYPTSIWVATGERSLDQVNLDLGDVARRHGFTFLEGVVESISAARRTVIVNGVEHTADHLVIAMGGDRLKPRGIEHTLTLGGAPENVE
jgi:sulfide:quinone oxidoreductase